MMDLSISGIAFASTAFGSHLSSGIGLQYAYSKINHIKKLENELEITGWSHKAGAALMAASPDFDYFIEPFFTSDFFTHRSELTHSLTGVAIGATIGAISYGKASNWDKKYATIGAGIYGSQVMNHLIFDTIQGDIELLQPFSDTIFNFELINEIPKKYLYEPEIKLYCEAAIPLFATLVLLGLYKSISNKTNKLSSE